MLKTLKQINYHKEQIHILVDAKLSVIISMIVAPFFMLFMLYGLIDNYIIYSVIAIQLLVLYIRFVLSNKIRKSASTIMKNIYLKYYLVALFTGSLMLGGLFILIVTYTNEQTVFFIFIMLLFLITGGIVSLAPIFHAITIYVYTILILAIIAFLFIGDLVLYTYMSSFIVLFIIMFTKSSFKVYVLLENSIKQNEELLEKNESFKNLLDSTMEAILILDLHNHKIIDANSASVKLFNFKYKDEISGLSLFKFIPNKEIQNIKNALNDESVEAIEAQFIKTNNDIFHSLISTKNIIRNKKQVRVVTILDLTSIKEKEKLLFSQSKLASMGEMIGNIAHQWRQPLSLISTIASGLNLKNEINMLSQVDIEKSTNKIISTSEHLSTTIDTFKNFLQYDKVLNTVIIQKELEKIIILFESTLINNKISFINNINMHEQVVVKIHSNELAQVLINIVNNAKDILIEKNIQNPNVTLDLFHDKDKLMICIQDNAGGIPISIIDKIFEPYFTTKHKSQGTGLGLHISYIIVTKSLKGKLSVENNNLGAKFIIELPLKNDVYNLS